jgi:AAA15 family ATPase/GTPase
MITAFTVKNFKAIGEEPVRIELKPITLLFGANSAGKSSILHALNYAYSVFNAYNLNAEYNLHTDSSFNLGGFKRFVHKNDLKRTILLRFEIDFDAEKDIPDECTRESEFYERDEEFPYSTIDFLRPKKLLEKVDSAYIQVEISWSENKKCPYVSQFETGLMGEWIANIYAEDFNDKIFIGKFNVVHPIFNNLWVKYGVLMDWLIRTCIKPELFVYTFNEYQYKGNKQDEICQKNPTNRSKILKKNGRIPVSDGSICSNLNITLPSQSDALPTMLYRLNIDKAVWNDHDDRFFQPADEYNSIQVGGPYCPPDNKSNSHRLKKNYATLGSLIVAFQDLLNSILVAPRTEIAKFLKSICYLGPLREIPPRNFSGDLADQLSPWRWERGLAAWDKLYQIGQLRLDHLEREKDADKVIKKINDWLSSDHRLNTGYKIYIERYREISSVLFKDFDEEKSQKDICALLKNILNEPEITRIWLHDISRGINVKPHEIGTGISQVLPVVVAATDADNQLVTIEQPELHIHPALQVRLGDLFIEEMHRKTFLIETHSEHLILRLMRRMRETFLKKDTGLPPLKPKNVSILYVEIDGSRSIVREMLLNEMGELVKSWPGGFFEEGLREQFDHD